MSISRDSLKTLYLELDQEMRESFDRSLPLDEYILDRFERAHVLGAGKKSSIHHSCYVYGKPTIGDNTWVGPFTLLDGSGGLNIGKNCSISAGVHIYTHDTVKKRLSDGKTQTEKGEVVIGDSCYIGPHSIIAKEVHLGDFCIVGANSFVSESFPPYSVIVGTPASLKGTVKFKDDKPYIEWLSRESLQKKIDKLEETISSLLKRVDKIEKI